MCPEFCVSFIQFRCRDLFSFWNMPPAGHCWDQNSFIHLFWILRHEYVIMSYRCMGRSQLSMLWVKRNGSLAKPLLILGVDE